MVPLVALLLGLFFGVLLGRVGWQPILGDDRQRYDGESLPTSRDVPVLLRMKQRRGGGS